MHTLPIPTRPTRASTLSVRNLVRYVGDVPAMRGREGMVKGVLLTGGRERIRVQWATSNDAIARHGRHAFWAPSWENAHGFRRIEKLSRGFAFYDVGGRGGR